MSWAQAGFPSPDEAIFRSILKSNPLYKAGRDGFMDDASYLFNGYTNVAMKSIGFLLNAGWFSSAEPIGKLGHFSIQVVGSLSNTPARDKWFYVDNSKLKYLQLKSDVDGIGQSRNIPTAFGDYGTQESRFEVKPEVTQFDIHSDQPVFLPRGSGINYFPSFYLKADIGLSKGTDLVLRYSPPLSYGTQLTNGKSGAIYGIGVLHSLSQWLFPIDRDFPFKPDIAIEAAYSIYSLSSETQVNMPRALNPLNSLVADTAIDYISFLKTLRNEVTTMDFSAFNINVIGSFQVGFFSPFVGVGYSIVSIDQRVKGNYPYIMLEQGQSQYNPLNKYWVGSIADPVKQSISYNNFMLSAGARFHFGAFRAHFAYRLQQYYSIYEIGLGIKI